jgi:hypothetical protein
MNVDICPTGLETRAKEPFSIFLGMHEQRQGWLAWPPLWTVFCFLVEVVLYNTAVSLGNTLVGHNSVIE